MAVQIFACVFAMVLGLGSLAGAAPPFDHKVEGSPVTVVGELTAIYEDDFENNRHRLFHELKDKQTGKRYEIHFKGKKPKELKTGTVVKVRGKAKGKDLVLALDEEGGGTYEPIIEGASVAVTGEQKTLVIIGDFLDKSAGANRSEIERAIFTDPYDKSVDDLYRETSDGQTWLSGQVVGPYTLNFTNSGCDIGSWADAADAAASSSGVNVGAYDRKVYVLPQGTCSGAGYGTVGGSPSRAWIFVHQYEDVIAHELGHNVGMGHAATPSATYGDETDFMGIGQDKLRQINAPHKEQMGWLPGTQIDLISQSGIFEVAPLELSASQAAAPQTLKIAKQDSGEHYYLSYRRAIGFDANMTSIHHDRLAIHRYVDGGRTYLLDELVDGESYTDSVNGITITQLSHNNSTVTVQIDVGSSGGGPTPCSPKAPSVAISPSSQTGSPGGTLSYSVSVTNNDNSTCSSSTFWLDRSVPSGWSGSLSKSSLTLSPGQSGSATLSVTSASGAADGSYGLSVNTSDSAESLHSASASASYTVLSACSASAPVVTLSPASQSANAGTKLNYTVSVTNTDDAACGSSTFALGRTVPSGWTGTLSKNSLALSPGQSGSATLSVTSPVAAAASTYGLYATVSDSFESAHTAYGAGSYTVNTTSTSDTQPPTAPTGLSASASRKNIALSWGASSDNVGVSRYTVYRDGFRIGDTTMTSFTDSSVTSGETYSYFVIAYDAAGNGSAAGNTATVTMGGSTKGGGGGKDGGGSKGGGKKK